MDNELTTEAAVPAQGRTELPAGFHEMVDDLKPIVRGAHVRAQLKVNTEMLQTYWETGRTILKRQGRRSGGRRSSAGSPRSCGPSSRTSRGFSHSNVEYMRPRRPAPAPYARTHDD
ncbi:DUF1016 N-terminal domain-containing protein [Streptomyces atroolivaceus]|uniref:hypothetical protein n=1 Tax=Streptomyces atroolivaceus TaxID=66869 RepID=UPI0036A99525